MNDVRVNGSLIDLSMPVVMGILNVTPDSFFEGGRYVSINEMSQRIRKIIDDGAAIIDVGAYSSRPGAVYITEKEELNRLLPAIDCIKAINPDFPISVDTFRASVVDAVVQRFGCVIVNDISGGNLDAEMFDVVASNKTPYICMHMRGNPQNKQDFTHYEDLICEIIDYFSAKISLLRKKGVIDVICDPGFGFSKTVEQNFYLLQHMHEFKLLDVPILAGLSRKTMIWKTLNIAATEALNGTSVLNVIAIQKGATILRVHDVREAVEIIKLLDKLGRTNVSG